MGCWQKQQDSKPSANIPISIVRPSSHDTSCSLPSQIVLTGSFSSSEHCLLTTHKFSAHNFLRFFYESPSFISFFTLRSGRHICLQTFAWHIFLARSSRTRTQPLLEMLRKVVHKQLARTSLRWRWWLFRPLIRRPPHVIYVLVVSLYCNNMCDSTSFTWLDVRFNYQTIQKNSSVYESLTFYRGIRYTVAFHFPTLKFFSYL